MESFVENTRKKGCSAFVQNSHFAFLIDKANEINLCGAGSCFCQRHIFIYEQLLEPHLYSPYLSMRCPAHPLVNKDGVGSHLICHYHSLERVRLQGKGYKVTSLQNGRKFHLQNTKQDER